MADIADVEAREHLVDERVQRLRERGIELARADFPLSPCAGVKKKAAPIEYDRIEMP